MTLHILEDIEQGSDSWHDQRRGLVTASVVGKLLTLRSLTAIDYKCIECGAEPNSPCISKVKRHGKVDEPIKTLHRARTTTAELTDAQPVLEVADNDTSRALTATLVAERITGWTEDSPMTSDMWRGVESEPYARDLYSGYYHQAVEVGFMVREEDGWTLGYSPDGLVGMDGLIEIKAPRAKTHLNTILANQVPPYYMAQCQAGLLVSGRDWLDFVSYVGGMPLYVKRVYPDPEWQDAIARACIRFEENVTELVTTYRHRVKGLPIADRIDFNTVELKLA